MPCIFLLFIIQTNTMLKYTFLLMLLVGSTTLALAQKKEKKEIKEDNPTFFDKKIRVGGIFTQSWSTIIGSNLPHSYFAKPSLGGIATLQYYFKKTIGVSVGLGYQQRGGGLRNSDFTTGLDDPDSTYLQRLRMHCIDLPLMLHWRSARPAVAGMRWTAGAGVIPSYMFRTARITHDVGDGSHFRESWNKDFAKFDIALTAEGGIDINASDACLFQARLWGGYGLLNPYKNDALFGSAKGNNLVLGLKIGFMF